MGTLKQREPAELMPDATPPDTPTVEGGHGKYDLALQEARRSFDEQAAQVGRGRAAMSGLLASGGIAFSVLVVAPGQIVGPHERPLLVAAAIAFALLAIGVVLGTLPIRITPGVRATDLITWADEADPPETSTRTLAYYYNEAYTANKKKIDRLAFIHMACLALLAATIVILTVRLMGA